jgi:hypothetical protein
MIYSHVQVINFIYELCALHPRDFGQTLLG